MANAIAEAEPEMIARFDEIGRVGGRFASPTGREAECRYWQSLGDQGVEWLIRHAQGAGSLAHASGIASVLESMGPMAITPILEALAAGPSNKVADILLSALAGMESQRIAPWTDAIAATLQTFLRQADDAIRTKAVLATAVILEATSLVMLRGRLEGETDPDVREAIQDEIERRR
jgi:hypothetical protein